MSINLAPQAKNGDRTNSTNSRSVPLKQHCRIGHQPFFPSCKSHFLCSGCFDGNIFDGKPGDICDGFLHLCYVGFDPGFFQAERAVDIDDPVAFFVNELNRLFEQDLAVNAFVGRISIRKMNADIAESECSQ